MDKQYHLNEEEYHEYVYLKTMKESIDKYKYIKDKLCDECLIKFFEEN